MGLTDHRATISDDFLATDLHAECSCGWVGENVRLSTVPLDTQRRITMEHLAMADFAAHVHVAEGLAMEDDDV